MTGKSYLRFVATASIFPLVTLAPPLVAQEADEAAQKDKAPAAAQIVVTGQGLPETPAAPAYSNVTITGDVLQTSPSGRIEDVLGNVAGFQQFRRSDSRSSNPSAQGVTLRALGGNATSRAQLLLDGVPMADPFFGYIPLSALAPERLGQVQVVRGGGVGPFGAGALAGTIAMETRDPSLQGPLTASALINDRGETELSGGVTQSLGEGWLTADARWDRGKGFYTTPEDQRVPATARAGFDSWSANLRMVAPVAPDVTVQARTLIFRDDRTLRFEGADSSSEGQDASLRIVGRGAWQFDALAYVQARDFSNVVISSSRFTRVLDQRRTPSSGLGGKLELRPPLGSDHVLRLGLDYRRTEGELQEEAYNAFSGALRERRRAGGRNSDVGLFVEHDWTLGALALTGGVRADRTVIANGFYRAADAAGAVIEDTSSPSRADWHVSWRAGAVATVNEALRLRGAAYRGLRLPTLNELYRPFVVFPVVTQANADLAPESLLGFEAGVDLTPTEGLRLSLTAFDNEVEDAIANVTLEPNLRQRRNLPAIKARGVEADIAVTRGTFSLIGSAVYTDAKVKGEGPSLNLDGLRPSQTPDFSASLSALWKPGKGWQLGASLRHVARQFEDDQEQDALPAATTLGLFAQAPVTDRLAVVLRAENVTDETIFTRNAGGSIDLGAPRTLWAGLRWGY